MGWRERLAHTRFREAITGKFSWEPIKLNTMVRELQPKVVISQRSGWMGDFETQEVRLGETYKKQAMGALYKTRRRGVGVDTVGRT